MTYADYSIKTVVKESLYFGVVRRMGVHCTVYLQNMKDCFQTLFSEYKIIYYIPVEVVVHVIILKYYYISKKYFII